MKFKYGVYLNTIALILACFFMGLGLTFAVIGIINADTVLIWKAILILSVASVISFSGAAHYDKLKEKADQIRAELTYRQNS